MTKTKISLLLLNLFLFTLMIINPALAQPTPDPLPSWSEGPVKQTIINFVNQVSDPHNATYVPPSNRIATFDNDGTLWVEKPIYIQVVFLLQRLKKLASSNPELANYPHIQEALAGNYDSLSKQDIINLIMTTHAGVTQEEFNKLAKEFYNTAIHPHFQKLYKKLTYQPMIELLEYLRSKEFITYICTGGGMDFVRMIAEENYGIPPEQVIGTNILKEIQRKDNKNVLIRIPELVPPINDKAGKPIHIDRHIGKKPILAVGNSDGDIEMLEYTHTLEDKNTLALLLNHDDEQREYKYNLGTEKALIEAKKQGWIIVSMKKDFQQIFIK